MPGFVHLPGWCDERQRDGLRTRHNGWAGSLVKPQRRNDDRVVTSQGAGAGAADVIADMPVPALPAPDVRRHEVDRKGVQSLAELFEYVSAAWDPGGSSYCATKTWCGCGLDDVFQGLASKEGLSATERSADAASKLLPTKIPNEKVPHLGSSAGVGAKQSTKSGY